MAPKKQTTAKRKKATKTKTAKTKTKARKKKAGVDKLWGMGLKAPQNKNSPYMWDKDLWR